MRRAEALRRDLDVLSAELEALRTALRDHPGGNFAHLAKLAGEEQALARRVRDDLAEWRQLLAELGLSEDAHALSSQRAPVGQEPTPELRLSPVDAKVSP